MDPEQVYQEVLQEEQQKGSTAVVAEARAKAARVRAEHGSPHPKEAKWWPGAQPHLEDGAGPPAEVETAEEEAPAEAPAEAPVDEAPAPEAAPAPAEQPAAAAPAEQPAAASAPAQPAAAQGEPAPAPAAQEPAAVSAQAAPPAAQPVAAPAQEAAATTAAPAPAEPAAAPPAPATPTELPPDQRPTGVAHGTTTGTRMRPEDEVATDAQLEGQRAMYERRKIIDELVGTGVPEVTASGSARSGSPLLALLYILIPLLAIAFIVSQGRSEPGQPNAEATATAQPGGGQGPLSGDQIDLTAQQLEFNTEEITVPAGEQVTVSFDNEDTAQHNFAVYESENAEKPIFEGEIIDAGSSTDYEFKAPKKGEYYFQCDVHPDMNGTFTAE